MSPFVPILFEGVKGWFSHRKQKAHAERELELEEIKQGIRGGDAWVKRLCFLVTFSPLVWGVFDIEAVGEYFKAMNEHMPAYYIEMVQGICASIWGGSLFKQIFSKAKK